MDTDLDFLNKNFKKTLVNIYTVPIAIADLNPTTAQIFSTGIFLEANASGIWIMSINKIRYGKKDFFYHNHIVKIEEIERVDVGNLPEQQKEDIFKWMKEYENKMKSLYDIEKENNQSLPDVADPTDQDSIITHLERVQKLVLENAGKGRFAE